MASWGITIGDDYYEVEADDVEDAVVQALNDALWDDNDGDVEDVEYLG